jgi:hypothetical protein
LGYDTLISRLVLEITSILARALQWVNINFLKNIKSLENVFRALGLTVMLDPKAMGLA